MGFSSILSRQGIASANADSYHTSMVDQLSQYPLGASRHQSSEHRPASRSEQIVVALRRAIVTLQLKPGVRLSEQEVASQFKVSRQPVREAFIRLTGTGLIEVHPQRGTFVAKISTEAVLDAQFVREAVETAIVRRATELAQRGDIAALEQELKLQRRAGRERDSAAFFELDEKFHRLIAAIGQRPNAWRAIEESKAQMDRVRYLTLLEEKPLKRRIEQHEEIVASMATGNAETAAAAMREHLSGVRTLLPRLVAQWPDLFDQ